MTTYYVDGAVGNDGNAGTSEGAGNAWATVQKAMDTVIAGDIVYVKSSATYTENVAAATSGGATSRIQFIGYDSTPGDNGKASITASTTVAISCAGWSNYTFKNLILTGGSSYAFTSSLADNFSFYNCEFKNAGADGVFGDNNFTFVNCVFSGNTSAGSNVDIGAMFVGCIFHSNGTSAINGSSNGTLYRCLIYNNGGTVDAIASTSLITMVGNTIDGDGTTADCVDSINVALDGALVADNIIHDFGGIGITFSSSPGSTSMVALNNLFSSITGNLYDNTYSAYGVLIGEGDPAEQAPAFTDEAGDDYTLSGSSPAIDAGIQPGGVT